MQDARKLASERRFIEARRDEADGATAAAGSPATLQQAQQGGPQQQQPGQHPEQNGGSSLAPARVADTAGALPAPWLCLTDLLCAQSCGSIVVAMR